MLVFQILYRPAVAGSSDKASFASSKLRSARKRSVWADFGFLHGFLTANRCNSSAPMVSEKSDLEELAKTSLQARGIKDAL